MFVNNVSRKIGPLLIPKFTDIRTVKSQLRCISSTLKLNKTKHSQGADAHPENPSVDFGFETVTPEEKAKKVHHVFENVAKKYDLMNDAMSAGVHRIWKDYFVSKMTPFSPGTKIVDVAGGTGMFLFN